MNKPTFTGGCLCGNIRFNAHGPIAWAGYCHCDSCRSITGAPAVLHVGFSDNDLNFEQANYSVYESSPGMRRGFCNQCGTPITTENDQFEHYIQVYLGTLDSPELIEPMAHVHCAEKISWFDINDKLPHFDDSAAADGSSWIADPKE